MQRRLIPSTSALLAFDAVARTGSFTAAARDLALTQGAVSRQVAQLEAQLGVTLIERSGRGTALSAAGLGYAETARAAIDLLGQGALQATGQTPERELRLAILPTFGTRWLMPRIPRFVQRHPEVTLNFETRIGAFDLREDRIDGALVTCRGLWPGAVLTQLIEETLVPVAAPSLLGERGGRRGPGVEFNLAGLPLLAMSTRPEGWAAWWAGQGMDGPVPAAAMRFEQVATLAQAAVAGMGVALMPALLVQPEIIAGDLVPVGPEAGSGYAYYFAQPEPRAGVPVKPSIRQFRDWLVMEVDRETWV
ncbi:LysR family transcriptional regulator [Pararhodobacter oceanensis]|uniref:LysR family transcriptional regulator n=1 Tax=Pararhodobacter oceanensis TaxID=2172121 RepID=UPI003A95C85A